MKFMQFAFVASLLTFAACNKNQDTDVNESIETEQVEDIENSVAVDAAEETEDVQDADTAEAPSIDEDLLDQEWAFTGINDDAFGDGIEVFISFDENGRIAGKTGCNRLMGGYSVGEEGAIEIQLGGSTLMMCGDAEMDAERAVLRFLPTVTHYELNEDNTSLTLSNEDGDALVGK